MPDKIYLGQKCIFDNDIESTGRNGNCLVLGGTGSGKTYSVTIPALTHIENENVIVTCAKKLVPRMLKKSLLERGYEVVVIDLADPENSPEGFDILQCVDSFTDLSYLSEAIVYYDKRKRTAKNIDPFWANCGDALLRAEILYVIMKEDKPTFDDVLRLHDSIKLNSNDEFIRTSMDSAFDRLAQKFPDSPALGWYKTFRDLAPRTAGCVSGELGSTLSAIFSEGLRKMIREKKSFDMERLINKKTALFLVVSPVEGTSHAYTGLVYSALIKYLFQKAEGMPFGKLGIPIRLICDDFALTPIASFPNYISVFRACGISATMLVQDLSQLEDTYSSEGAQTIINNCDQLIYMGGMDKNTISEFAQRTDRPFTEIQSLEIGKEIVIRRGDGYVFDNRYDVFKDPVFIKIKEDYERKIEAR